MKLFTTAAAISVTLFVAGCSSDSAPATQTTTTPSTSTPVSTIPAATPNFSGGLASSGGFSSMASWSNGNGDDLSGNVVVENDNTVFSWDVTAATPDAPWNQNLQQTMDLDPGKSYTIKFKARSDRSRSINVGIGLNQDPWTNITNSVSLTTDWQDHELTLLAPNFGDAPTRLFFEFAGELGLVMLDEVSIVEAAVTTPEPSDLAQIDLPINFEGSTVDYTVTDFGGTSSALVADPADSTNMVIRTVKGADAATWAGTTAGKDVDGVDGDGGVATVIPFTASATTMSVRVYSPDAGIPVLLKVESANDNTKTAETITYTTVANQWETLVFDLNMIRTGTAAFDPSVSFDKVSIFFNFDVDGATAGEKTYYWDDVAFGGTATTTPPPVSNATEPTDAPAAPPAAASDVISIYSEAFTSIANVDTNPNWGQATVTTEETIAGNKVLKMSGLNYQGIAWNDNKQNVSCFTTLNVDYWTADATQLDVFAIGALSEAAFNATVATGSWQRLAIPLSTYSSVGLTEAREFKFVGNGTVYIDNLYFSNAAGQGTSCAAAPADPAPTDAPAAPTLAAGSVSSIYSDAYTDVALSAFPTVWSNATIAEQTIASNAVQKLTGGFIGVEPAAGIDGTNYTHMHIDVWAAEGTNVLLKVRDYGANGVWDADGDDSEVIFTHTLSANSAWESIDVPLTNATKASLSQIVIDAQGAASKIYFDNIYLY